MADETYYSLLGLSETASAAEIKAAYLRLISEVHPDKLANAPAYWQRQAEEKTKEINEAYDVLKNREKRLSYDAQLAVLRGTQQTNGGTSNAQASTAPPPSSTQQQRSQTSSGWQSGSGASTPKTPSSASQGPQTAPTSATSTNVPSPSSSQASASRLSDVQRFVLTFFGGIFAFWAVDAFWTSSSTSEGLVTFILATTLLFGVACLYQ